MQSALRESPTNTDRHAVPFVSRKGVEGVLGRAAKRVLVFEKVFDKGSNSVLLDSFTIPEEFAADVFVVLSLSVALCIPNVKDPALFDFKAMSVVMLLLIDNVHPEHTAKSEGVAVAVATEGSTNAFDSVLS